MSGIFYYGYFDSPEQKEPKVDPGVDGIPCPICHAGLMRFDLKTVSLMATGDNKSYFYRTHKSCYEELSDEGHSQLDSVIIDHIAQGEIL